MPYRVVQWTTGNVGRRALRAIVDNPNLELVGCYAWSPEKVGRDAGELVGIPKLGVSATDDVDALLALRPDCVNYSPMWPSVDEMVRILQAGINISSTAAFITGRSLGEAACARLEDACRRGQSSLFGSGMNPGFANPLALVSAGICDRIDSISVLESVDSTQYASADTERSVGYGRRPDDSDLHATIERGSAVFGDGVCMMADALGVELDDIVCHSGVAVATQDLDLGYMRIDEGCVAGIEASWQGRVQGRTRIDLQVRWRKGKHLKPDWPVEHGYVVRIEGRPCVETRLQIRPPRDFDAKSFEDFMQLGMIITALPAVNAIPAVCEAPAGIRTYRDLPLVTGRGFMR